MAIITPFRGIRYNPKKIADLSAVIAPPYDVIDKQGQDVYYNLNPYNIIRLEYGRDSDKDHPGNNRYTRASQTFAKWLDQEILILENQPVFYLYQQSFHYQGTRYNRTGIIAALKVEPYHTGSILPHEQTLSLPKADRLELLRSCRANFSPIFTLFSDPENQIDRICDPLFNQPPLFEFSDQTGQTHRLWPVTDPRQQKALQELISPLPLLIADGHHRYETSLRFSQETSGPPGYSHALTIMVSMHSPDLLILPTHRLLSGLSLRQVKALPEIVSRNFNLYPRGLPENLSGSDFLRELQQQGQTTPALGLVLPSQVYLLALKQPFSQQDRLDVTLLQDLVIKPLLEGTAEGTAERVTGYTTDQQEVIEAVVKGNSQAGFILNPTPVQEVVARAQRGEKMPQKSTYFFPKLPSGLVIYSLEKSL